MAVVAAMLLAAAAASADTTGPLTPEVGRALESARFVYISSTRKDGSLSAKAEIWFSFDDGKVYVGTRPDSWRVKRIRWGRPAAKIWVGSREGPSFEATGAVVDDPAAQRALLAAFARKYPEGWARHEEGFRKGFQDGSRVLVAYTPAP